MRVHDPDFERGLLLWHRWAQAFVWADQQVDVLTNDSLL